MGAVGCLGCGPGGKPGAATAATTAPTTSTSTSTASEVEEPKVRLVTVTVVSGEVEGRMPNGEQWDEKEHKGKQPIDKTLALYWKGHPELADTQATIGVPVDAAKLGDEARKTPAADPMVLVQIDGVVFRSTVRPRAFNPLWEFPLQFAAGPNHVSADTPVRIHVVDYDGPTRFDSLGTTVITVEELLSKRVHTIGPFGSVKKLTLEVDAMDLPEPPSKPSVFRIAVPGNSSWTDGGFDVTAGQHITIDAADEVCTNGSAVTSCSGPEGQRTTSKYNLPGFEKLSHGALVAAVGDTRFAIKRERTFIAPSSGRLWLGINDRDFTNNRGSYAVRITIAAPGQTD